MKESEGHLVLHPVTEVLLSVTTWHGIISAGFSTIHLLQIFLFSF